MKQENERDETCANESAVRNHDPVSNAMPSQSPARSYFEQVLTPTMDTRHHHIESPHIRGDSSPARRPHDSHYEASGTEQGPLSLERRPKNHGQLAPMLPCSSPVHLQRLGITGVSNVFPISGSAWMARPSLPSVKSFHAPFPILNQDETGPVIIRDADPRQVDEMKPGCAQPSHLEQQSRGPPKSLQQRDLGLVPVRPQLQLAMQWRVPDTAQSITFALKGDITGLKDLFSRRLASPSDVSNSRGFSLIRVGILHTYHSSGLELR
jgi:hypothetical protein